MTLLLGLVFLVSVQPLVMIMMMLGIVLLYSLDIYYESMSFWFGYILMLIILSGVLVIFTYVVSLIPNESFEYFSILIIFMIMLFFFVDKKFMMLDNQSLLSILLWEGMMSGYMIYLGIFLLVVMIMVNFLSNAVQGALRVY